MTTTTPKVEAVNIDTDRLREIETWTLLSGSHPEGQEAPVKDACVLEAVSYVAREPWSDSPQCACPVIGSFLRSWNDGIRDDETRTRLLRPLVPRLVGSKSTPAIELRRSYMALDWLVRVQTPAWLDAAGLTDKSALLRELGELHDEASCKAAIGAVRDAQRSADAARAAARAAAGDVAWATARATARATAWAAACASAWATARDAAGDAARAAAGDVAWATARDAAGDAAGAAACAAAGAAACAAACAAAGESLAPTVAQLQESALELVDRMLEVRA
jgi:hypothetical protein